MGSVSVFIDGFNVYHALESNRRFHRYKWLDYEALAKCYVGGHDILGRVHLFTSLTTWDNDKVSRHQAFLSVRRRRGVEIVMGKLMRKDKRCPLCKQSFRTFEKKLTDVNIAIRILAGAISDAYDKAVPITGDTDIVPAAEMIHRLFPAKQVGLVVPIGRRCEDLKAACDYHFKMKERQLARCQLPDVVHLDEKTKVERPKSWR